jgi:hypothetical protein
VNGHTPLNFFVVVSGSQSFGGVDERRLAGSIGVGLAVSRSTSTCRGWRPLRSPTRPPLLVLPALPRLELRWTRSRLVKRRRLKSRRLEPIELNRAVDPRGCAKAHGWLRRHFADHTSAAGLTGLMHFSAVTSHALATVWSLLYRGTV